VDYDIITESEEVKQFRFGGGSRAEGGREAKKRITPVPRFV